jgi:hypothetical protein
MSKESPGTCVRSGQYLDRPTTLASILYVYMSVGRSRLNVFAEQSVGVLNCVNSCLAVYKICVIYYLLKYACALWILSVT